MVRPDRRLLLIAGATLAVIVAVPVLGADPSPGPGGPRFGGPPSGGPAGREEARERKAARGPEIAAELRGVVTETTDDKGRATFTMTVDGTTWELSAGPKWFWGTDHPLRAFAGDTVTVTGTYHEGDTDLSVDAVDGTPLRGEGRPPWAGGPRAQGERHPGWKAWKTGEGDHPGNGRPDHAGPPTDD